MARSQPPKEKSAAPPNAARLPGGRAALEPGPLAGRFLAFEHWVEATARTGSVADFVEWVRARERFDPSAPAFRGLGDISREERRRLMDERDQELLALGELCRDGKTPDARAFDERARRERIRGTHPLVLDRLRAIYASIGELLDLADKINAVSDAPTEMRERVVEIAGSYVANFASHSKAKPWEHVLRVAVAAVAKAGGTRDEKVRAVLELISSACADDLPAAFREPTKERVKAAAVYIGNMRHADAPPELRPKQGAGKPVSSWGAARGFARCFGVPMAAKESRLKRRN